MSKVNDNDTKDSDSENTFNGGSNTILKNLLTEGCTSTQCEEIKQEKREIFVDKTNIINDNPNSVNIGENKFQIKEIQEEFIPNKSTKNETTVTVDNKSFELLTKISSQIKVKEESDVDSGDEENEQKENDQHKEKIPLVEKRVFTPWYNLESMMIQNRIPYDKKYVERMNRDTAKCLQHMKEIIHLILVGLDDAVIDNKIISNILEKIEREIKGCDETFTISSSEGRKKLKGYLLTKIQFIIEEQIQNKRTIVMGYPALTKFDPNNILINYTAPFGKELYFSTQSEESQSYLSEEQDINEDMLDSLIAMETLQSMEIRNSERKKFTDDLFRFMDSRGIPIYDLPAVNDLTMDIFLLYKLVIARGGFVEVTKFKLWPEIYNRMYSRNHRMYSHIYGYNTKIGSSFLKFYYSLYLYSYEQWKESFPDPSWLLPADNVYPSDIRTTKVPKFKDQLSCKRSNLSNIAIQNLVQYLKSNQYPDPDLFSKSINYLLNTQCNTDEHFATNSSTNTISETSMSRFESPPVSLIQLNKSNIQIGIEMQKYFQNPNFPTDSSTNTISEALIFDLKSPPGSQIQSNILNILKRDQEKIKRKISNLKNMIDLLSNANQKNEEPKVKIPRNEPETPLLTQELSINESEIKKEETESIIHEFPKDYPPETTSKIITESKLELKSEMKITTEVSSDKMEDKEISNIDSSSSYEEDFLTAEGSSNDEYF